MKLMRSPRIHPLSFGHRIGNTHRPLFDRNFFLSRDPFADERIVPSKKLPMNISQQKDIYSLELPVPGYRKKELYLELNNNVITIKGKKEADLPPIRDYILNEHRSENFEESIVLDPKGNYNEIDINAELKDGILHIFIKKKRTEKLDKNIPVT